MPEAVECRFTPSDEAGLVAGYGVVWNVLDRHGTAFAPGSLDASLADIRASGHRVPMLWAHDPARVIGAWDRLEADEHGLRVEGRLVTDTRDGADALAHLRAGSLNGLSIGFRRLADEPRAGGGRTITRAELVEISLVAVPSNNDARTTEVRGTPEEGTITMLNAAPVEHRAEPNTGADDGAGNETDLGARVAKVEEAVASIGQKVDALAEKVGQTEQRADRIEARSARVGLGSGAGAGPDPETRAFGVYLRRGSSAVEAHEMRAMSASTDSQGGFLVPDGFRAELLKRLIEVSPMRTLCTVTPTGTDALILPKVTANPTSAWVAELGTRTSSEPTVGQVKIDVHEASIYTDISRRLLEDSAINLQSELAAILSQEYARLEGQAFVSGDGTGKPRGFLSHPDFETVAAGSTSALSADKLIEVMHSLPAQYRNKGTWVMNGTTTLGKVRSFKNSSGDYLWRDALSEGNPGTILGRPVVELPDMPDIASGEVPIAFGDFKVAYRIAQRVEFSILRDDYTQAVSGLVRFFSRARLGGDLVQAAAIKGISMTA
ncbi:phage major capsid protein [Pararhodospirillum photometricum]|uniref:Phage major capsid protein, HK97 family n=1 Tax=Pararhodospirillum photometricum DSM 122 TaxID=1150469 RepID=H6SQ75_PARPM|nr:phage major capsid protein [Pararhodospirillum photometricum]CCG09594.1 Phage major capsid protein, HK97 family [Pararhodospirillum photometricum DSM 122]